MLGSKCDLKIHVQNLGYLLPLQIRSPKTTLFGRFRNLTTTLTAYIFGKKHDIHNRANALQITSVSYIVLKRYELWSTNGFKLELNFHPPSVNFAWYFIARLRRQRQANGSQPNFAIPYAVNYANKSL